jgi:hypothetical protein
MGSMILSPEAGPKAAFARRLLTLLHCPNPDGRVDPLCINARGTPLFPGEDARSKKPHTKERNI